MSSDWMTVKLPMAVGSSGWDPEGARPASLLESCSSLPFLLLNAESFVVMSVGFWRWKGINLAMGMS
jgi:hypothetical protein